MKKTDEYFLLYIFNDSLLWISNTWISALIPEDNWEDLKYNRTIFQHSPVIGNRDSFSEEYNTQLNLAETVFLEYFYRDNNIVCNGIGNSILIDAYKKQIKIVRFTFLAMLKIGNVSSVKAWKKIFV